MLATLVIFSPKTQKTFFWPGSTFERMLRPELCSVSISINSKTWLVVDRLPLEIRPSLAFAVGASLAYSKALKMEAESDQSESGALVSISKMSSKFASESFLKPPRSSVYVMHSGGNACVNGFLSFLKNVKWNISVPPGTCFSSLGSIIASLRQAFKSPILSGDYLFLGRLGKLDGDSRLLLLALWDQVTDCYPFRPVLRTNSYLRPN